VRTAPGDHEAAKERLHAAAAGLDVELLRDEPGYASPLDARLPRLVADLLRERGAVDDVVPFVLPAATDGRHFARLGIRSYGFIPLPLPADFEPLALFHAAGERIPVSALTGGAELLSELVTRW
jgi:acetylornithine deacetylase/succinyl-diaminopimelate desuccinylase-like protein